MKERRAKICLITPGHLSTNPRLVKEADALDAAGHDVTVIAATYQPWAREADKSFASKPWRIAQPLPFGPHAPRRIRVWQLGRQRLARGLVRGGAHHLAVVRAAFHPVAPDLVRALGEIPADLYIAHYPAALPAAALAARRQGSVYAFDAEDFHQGEFEHGVSGEGVRRMIAAIESAYLPGCAYVTAASPGIADAYAATYGITRPTVVLNAFPRAQAPDGATGCGTAVPGPSVYWFSQTIGPNRGLETAIRAIARAKSQPHLYLRGILSSGYLDQIERLAQSMEVRDRLHILPPAPPGEMERLAAAYDLGFSGEPGHTVNNRLALGNKIFSYLLAGLPVLASDTPAHTQLAPSLGSAIRLFSIEDPQSAADGIDHFLYSNSTLTDARQVAFDFGRDKFNWDIEQQVVIDRVDEALTMRQGPGQ